MEPVQPTTVRRSHARHVQVLCPPDSGPAPHQQNVKPTEKRVLPQPQVGGYGSIQPSGVRISQFPVTRPRARGAG